MSTLTVVLVSCGGSKQSRSAPARELYTGDLFRKSRAYAEAVADRWYVLSAKHRLVHPDRVLEPYDMAMTDLGHRYYKQQWAILVDGDLRLNKANQSGPDHHLPGDRMFRRTIGLGHWVQAGHKVRIVVLAGAEYREHLVPILEKWASVEVPLAHLNIGQQKSWLLNNTPDRKAG